MMSGRVYHNIKWDHFEILATGRSDMHCKIKESLLIRDLKPALNENVGSEKLHLYYCRFMSINFASSQFVQLYFLNLNLSATET